MSYGKLLHIFTAPGRRKPMIERRGPVQAVSGQGLVGDRYATGQGSYNQDKVGKRQVTFINARFVQGSGFASVETRRNLVVEDVELMYLIGREFHVGEATFRGVKYCDPCRVPRASRDPSLVFSEAFQDQGGLIAEVLVSGLIAAGNNVVSPPKGY